MTLHRFLLLLHIGSVVIAMGTAVFLHLNVLRKHLRWGSFREFFYFGSKVIWVGLAAAIVSGILLWVTATRAPHPPFYGKLALVAMLIVDGIVINRVGKPRLNLLKPEQHFFDLPSEHKRAFQISGALSVLGWWGAFILAFVR